MELTMTHLFDQYASHQEALGFSPKVLNRERRELQRFLAWADAMDGDNLLNIDPSQALAYQAYLATTPFRGSRLLDPATVSYKLNRIKRFYRWLHRRAFMAANPFGVLVFPKERKQYKRQPLTETEVKRLLEVPDVTTANGIRVRAILETFYSSALREMELARLFPYDVDMGRGWVRITQGKHRKDRMVPVGESALHWMARYLKEVRPNMAAHPDSGHLFLNQYGYFFKHQGALSTIVKRYLKKIGVEREGSCHLLRHSAATHMLNRGADIRYVKEMLGHQSLRTTQQYTKLTCTHLMKVYKRSHPWA